MELQQLEMISEFQCPGCTLGTSPCQECPSFANENKYGFGCSAHSAGTLLVGGGWFYLGLPKGFNRVGAFVAKGDDKTKNNIRLWIDDPPEWDELNCPIWGMEKDGCLFVRTYLPRTNRNFIDIIKGGTFDMLPETTVDVAKFIDEID